MTIHHIKADYEPRDSDVVQLASIPVTIEFEYTPAGGDGWNEPRYDATIEYVGVTFEYPSTWEQGVAAQHWVKSAIEEWAAEWVNGDGRMVCIRAVDDAAEMAREYAADLRRDR